MKKGKILLIVLPIILLILALLSYFKLSSLNTDAMKFKREYEKYIHEKEKTRFSGFCNHCSCIIT